MGEYRSKFYSDEDMQIEPYYGPSPTARPKDFRSYSTSYASSSSASSYYHTAAAPPQGPPQKLKKGKSTGGSSSRSWSLDDPELQRKKRVASYKAYSVEGKMKGSFRKSFRWLKDKYTHVFYGW